MSRLHDTLGVPYIFSDLDGCVRFCLSVITVVLEQ